MLCNVKLEKSRQEEYVEDIRKGRWRSTGREEEEMDGARCLGALDDDTFIFLLDNGGLECCNNGLVKNVFQTLLRQG